MQELQMGLERLNQLRQRLARPAAPAVWKISLMKVASFSTLKDVIGFAISIAAFLISLYSLYATNRKVDQLGVIFADDVPLIDIHTDGQFNIVKPTATATFVNSGTRYAAVVGVRFVVEQFEELSWRPCEHAGSTILTFEVEPFVIKPNEIVAKYLKLDPKEPMTIPVRNAAHPSALLCLEFDVTTPDQLTLQIARPFLSGSWVQKSGIWEFVPKDWLPGKTVELIGK
jgi:hypothetical protein